MIQIAYSRGTISAPRDVLDEGDAPKDTQLKKLESEARVAKRVLWVDPHPLERSSGLEIRLLYAGPTGNEISGLSVGTCFWRRDWKGCMRTNRAFAGNTTVVNNTLQAFDGTYVLPMTIYLVYLENRMFSMVYADDEIQ
jgi:hypothetical protein